MGSNTALAMQAQVLHRLLTHNAKLLAKNTAALKEWQIGPSSHPSFLPIQAAILELAIADSVSLTAATSSNAQRKITHSALLMKLVKRVQMVLEDAALLQNAADSSGTGEDDGTGKEIVEEEEEEPELQTITTSFAMELLSDISDLIDDNASARSTQEISISDASEDSSLNMSKPQFVKSLLKALRICVENSRKAEKRYLQARINHLETEQAKLEAEKALQSMTTELDQLNSVHAETEEELASERRTAEQLTTENILLVQAHELRARQQGMEMRVSQDSVSSSQPPNSQDSASASRKRKSRWHHFLDLPSWGLQLPPGRARAAARLPTVEVTLPEGEDVLAVFSQDSLGHILGVSRHSIFARVGQDTHPFGAMYGITDYLLTILEEHPWAPTCPGQHGYVVVGLRGEKDLFKDGQCKHLFAGVGKQYHYCGWYKMIIDEPLGPDEWVMLPPTVKRTLLDKCAERGQTTEAKCMRMYTTGEGRFPCVRLQCIKFDARFYKNLVSENDEYFKSRYFPSSDTAEWRNPAKRRKLSHSEHASGSTFQVGSVSTTTSAGPVTPSSSRMSTPISSSRSATPTPSRGSGPPSIKGEDGDHNIDDMYAD